MTGRDHRNAQFRFPRESLKFKTFQVFQGGLDSDWLRAELNERGALAVIPPNGSRSGTIPYDEEMYKWRHLVENFFQKIREFRRIATRYDKTDTSFRAAIHLVASFLALK